jgi:hypothetical protein
MWDANQIDRSQTHAKRVHELLFMKHYRSREYGLNLSKA